MDLHLAALFVESSARRLQLHVDRIVRSLEPLNEEQVWARGSDQENAVGNLVLHLSGNVRQLIIAAIGGKPDIRVRDREFSARGGIAKEELAERLQGIVNEAVAVIQALPQERLAETVAVGERTFTVLDAVYHVVDHFALHTGQIIFASKQFQNQAKG